MHADELRAGSERLDAALTTVSRMHERHGPEAVDTLVVSATSAAADVLRALELSREHGLELSVVPLFETIASLRAAAETVESLLDDDRVPATRASVVAHGWR